MKIIHIGVGEAADESLPNNSHLILSETKLLLDCGYSVPRQLWKYNSSQSFIDAIYISHRHADHYFGLPALLVRMWEEKRKKPLTIICQKGMKALIQELIEFGYKGLTEKFEFGLKFIEVTDQDKIKLNEFELEFAPTLHSVENLAIKIRKNKIRKNFPEGSNEGKIFSLCYSGDGMFTDKTENLYKNSDLVIHEAYLYDEKKPGHACVTDLIDLAKRADIKCLALTHLQRDFRKNLAQTKQRIEEEKDKIKIIIPYPLETFEL